jgi:hypothetical protein
MRIASPLGGIASRSAPELQVLICRTSYHIDFPCTYSTGFGERDFAMINVVSILVTCPFIRFATKTVQLVSMSIQ